MSRRLLALFLALLAILLLHPALETGDVGRWILVAMYSIALGGGVIAAARDTKTRLWTGLAATPALILAWANLFIPGISFAVLQWIFIAAFLVYVAYRLGAYLFSEKAEGRLFAALTVYLLLGHIFAAVYIVVELTQPGSFRGLSTGNVPLFSDLFYFSFVTLTTLGYGDITPLSSQARSLTILEALTGVLYVATMIARLVGQRREDAG